jgi:hypothetical protein
MCTTELQDRLVKINAYYQLLDWRFVVAFGSRKATCIDPLLIL